MAATTLRLHHPQISLSLYPTFSPPHFCPWHPLLWSPSQQFSLLKKVMCMRYRMKSFWKSFFHSVQCLGDAFHLFRVSKFCSLSLLCSIPPYGCTTDHLSLHLVTNICVVCRVSDYELSCYKHWCTGFCVIISFQWRFDDFHQKTGDKYTYYKNHFQKYVIFLLSFKAGGGIAGSYVKHMVNFMRNRQIALHSECTILSS